MEHCNTAQENRWGHVVKLAYRRVIFPCISSPLHRQRIKLLWFVWGYWPVVMLKQIPLSDRLQLLTRFLRIDWNIVHGHLSSEIIFMCKALVARKARSGEVVVEAGCWKGGSAAKLSILCKMLGYRLLIYDSFEGVETPPLQQQEREVKSFFGEYSASERLVRENLAKYGEPAVCEIIKGWFSETLARVPVPHPVRLGYIDCDLVKGTEEALAGLIPSLVSDGQIFSEDYHIQPVRNMLNEAGSFERFGRGSMVLTPLGPKLARIRFKDANDVCGRNQG